MVGSLLRVISRHDGNPFALTRLLCTPSLLPRLLSPPHAELTSQALSFVVFGIQQFDNPAFTEDGIKVLLALLRQQCGARATLEHEASLHMLETLAAASTYLPSAVASLELLALSEPGRLCLNSLGARLGAEQAPINASRSRDSSPGGLGEAHTDGAMSGGASADAILKSSDAAAPPSQGLQQQSLPDSSKQLASSPKEAPATSDWKSFDRRHVHAEAHGSSARTTSSWGIFSAMASARTFIRSLRGLIAIGALKRRLSRAKPSEEFFGGWFADTHAGEVPSTDVLDEIGGGPSAALGADDLAGTDATDASDSEGEASDDSDDAGGSDVEDSPAAHADILEEEGPGATVLLAERWDTFLLQLRGGPTAAGLVRLRPSGIWQGLAETHGSVTSSDATEPGIQGGSSTEPGIQGGSSTALNAAPAASVTPWLPTWPVGRVQPDVVQAWVILEVAGIEPAQEENLLARMTLAHKRVWLMHRLHREHHGSRVGDEDPILFIECTREDTNGAVFQELRDQAARKVGLGGDLTGTLEVHFKDENSAGDAVKREWFSVISDTFLDPKRHLLVSPDGGRSFRPRALAPWRERGTPHDEGSQAGIGPLDAFASHESGPPQTDKVAVGNVDGMEEGCDREILLRDYEILGRFIGLALLQQVTIGVRLHPSVCRLLLNGGAPYDYTPDDVLELDPMLFKHNVQYVLENDVEALCLDFTDIVEDLALSEGAGESMAAAERRVELKPGGADLVVTNSNKAEYVDLVCRWRLIGSIHEPVSRYCGCVRCVFVPSLIAPTCILPAEI
jgi:hypothetical protein